MTSTSLSSDNMRGARTGGAEGRRAAMALIREDLRRYWIIAFVAGLGYFLVTILPILLNYHSFDNIAGYIQVTLAGQNPFVLTIDVVLALVASVSLLGYLHRTDSCISIHSMPANRTQLMGASMTGGILLMLLPLVVTAVLMLVCRGATMSPEALKAAAESSYGITQKASEVILPLGCCKWLVKNLVVCFYTFVVSCLAGVLAGTKTIHVLTALFFNGLAGIVIFLSYVYQTTFLKGFPTGENRMFELIIKTSPVIYCGTGGSMFGSAVAGYGCFVLVSVLLAILTFLIYGRVQMERVGDATMFPLMGDFLCVTVSFVCMSGFSFVAAELSVTEDFNRMFLLYAACSGVVAFLVFRMVADSTTHILNLRNLGKFLVFVVLVAVVFALTVFDVTGYGKLVPKTEDVAKATVWNGDFLSQPAEFTEADQIDAVRSMQKAAMDRKSKEDDVLIDSSITYTLKNGRVIRREYDLSAQDLAALAPVQRTKPFLQAEQFHLTGSGRDLRINGIESTVYLEDSEGELENLDIELKDIQAVIGAMNKDMVGMEFKYVLGLESEGILCNLTITYDSDEVDSEEAEGSEYNSAPNRTFFIDKHWPNTAKVLKDLGYLEKLKHQPKIE